MLFGDNYDLAEEQLKAFTRSSIRTKIMLCLKDYDMDSSGLGDRLGIRATTVLHSIKNMTELELIKRSKEGYTLTNIGKIQALLIDKLVRAIDVLDAREDFWQTHDLSGIPKDILTKIGMLSQSEVITSNSSAPLLVLENFLAELNKAREIYGVSPVIYPGFSEAIAKAIKKGAHVEIILTDKILESVVIDYADVGRDLLNCDNFRLYRIGIEVKEAFTVTDTILSFALFRLDGDFDIDSDLICRGDLARTWGMELFNYYLKMSKKIDEI